MQITLLTAQDLRQALPMSATIQAMRSAFAALSTGQAVIPLRTAVAVPAAGGTVLVKPGLVPGTGLGAKLVSIFPGNADMGRTVTTGIVILLDPDTGEPQCLCDGTFLTAWRTGAASGIATDLLALPTAKVAALVGCGAQGRAQALAIDSVRQLQVIRVYARTRSSVQTFITEMEPRLKARLVAAQHPAEAIDGAEVICAATTSPTPVFDGRRVRPGAHINGVGSFTLAMQELDAEIVARARVFVDRRESALAEAGDLVIAQRQGKTEAKKWTELGEVITGAKPGRLGDEEITLFKSVGSAVQDLAAASLALKRARELGLGALVEL